MEEEWKVLGKGWLGAGGEHGVGLQCCSKKGESQRWVSIQLLVRVRVSAAQPHGPLLCASTVCFSFFFWGGGRLLRIELRGT